MNFAMMERSETNVVTQMDEEIKQYLRLLLDHCDECNDPGCSSHLLLEEICRLVRERIFMGAIPTPPAPVEDEDEPRTDGAVGTP